MSELGVEYGCPYELVGPDGTRVVFNDDSDEDFIGILNPESSGLDSPDIREDAVDAVEEDGGHHGDFFYGRRPVVLQGTIIASGPKDRNEKVAKLKRATHALRGDATLTWEPESGPEGGVELKLRRQQPLRVTKGYVKDFQAPMVSADAYVKSATVQEVGGVEEDIVPVLVTVSDIEISGSYIYWTERLSGRIGRAELDGSEANKEFITGLEEPIGVTVDATYIYWTNKKGEKIGRAKLNGTSVEKEFITAAGASVNKIAVNATHIYWGNRGGEGWIARATITGAEKNTTWLSTPTSNVGGIALDSTYMYWADEGLGEIASYIGRAKLDGTSASTTFITGIEFASDVVFDILRITPYIYFSYGLTGQTGRAAIDGSDPKSWTAGGLAIAVVDLGSFSNAYVYSTPAGTRIDRRLYMVSTDVKNGGDVAAFPTIKVYGPGSTFELENATTEESILLEGIELKAGEYFEIDFNNRTILKNGETYAYSALVFASSTWWALEPGANSLVLPPGAEIEWQDTYL
jgi:Siphovirus-type tail component, C-terminal domain